MVINVHEWTGVTIQRDKTKMSDKERMKVKEAEADLLWKGAMM